LFSDQGGKTKKDPGEKKGKKETLERKGGREKEKKGR
jgi:hypothetical protein